MLTLTDLRFFEALRSACGDVDGLDANLTAAIHKALETGAPSDLLVARKAFDGLDAPLKVSLMQQVHHHMATDISAILDALSGAGPGQRPN